MDFFEVQPLVSFSGVKTVYSGLFWLLVLGLVFRVRADATKVSESRPEFSKVYSVIVRSAVCTSETGISNFGLSGSIQSDI